VNTSKTDSVGDIAKGEIFREEGKWMEVAQACAQWQTLVLVTSKLGGGFVLV
jgi:hypothetical protein